MQPVDKPFLLFSVVLGLGKGDLVLREGTIGTVSCWRGPGAGRRKETSGETFGRGRAGERGWWSGAVEGDGGRAGAWGKSWRLGWCRVVRAVNENWGIWAADWP